MAAAIAAATVGVKPLPLRGSLCSIGRQRLCFNSLAFRPACLRRKNAVVYGFNPARRMRFFALAEQQASQTEVQQVEEDDSDGAVEDGAPQVNGSEATQTSPSLSIEALLRSYSEAVLGNDEAAMKSIQAQLETLQKEKDSLGQLVASLTEEAALAKERLVRLNADFDNFRKRSAREKDSLAESVKGDVIESLLPMIDNFERAKASIKAETEGEKKIDSSYQSIYKQFVDIMKGLGVKVIDTVGKDFNPELHEAIMREESEEYKEGVVTQEFRRGFLLGEKLLRPAMVKVSAGKSKPADNEASDSAAEQQPETEAAAGSSSTTTTPTAAAAVEEEGETSDEKASS